MFLRVTLYFGEPVGRVKIQETSKNIEEEEYKIGTLAYL